MVVDAHTHVLDRGFWAEEWYDWAALQWASRAPGRDPSMVRAKVEEGLIDPTGEHMVSAMDAARVDVAVVLPMDWGPDFTLGAPVEQMNEHALELAGRYPGRFVPFVGVDPRRPGAADLVERFLRDKGAQGLKLNPSCGWDPYEPAARPLYELAVHYDVPVLFHTGETLPRLSVRYSNPILLQDVHAAFPRLKSWIGHAGAKIWWKEALSVAASSINGYLETSVWIWNDTTVEEQEQFIRHLAEARDKIGIERILFGSDHLSGTRVRGDAFLPRVVDWYRDLPQQAAKLGIRFSDDEVEKLLGGNAAEMVKLEAAPA